VLAVFADAHAVEQGEHTLSPLARVQRPLQKQRQFYVLQDAEHGDQIEALEDEPMVFSAVGQVALGEQPGLLAIAVTVPALGIHAAHQVEQGGLATPDGPAMARNSPSATSRVTRAKPGPPLGPDCSSC